MEKDLIMSSHSGNRQDRPTHRPLGAAVLAAVLGGMIAFASSAQAQMPGGPPQAIPVGVLTIKAQPVRLWSSFSGRLHAVESAEIRPQVSGLITQVRFKDGQIVKAGDVLVVIDPRPFEAAVAKADANLASARTNADFAKTEFERAQSMLKTGAIAQRIFDERANTFRVTQAAVNSAAAELAQAKIDLDHAFVKAPIGGRTGRVEITVGNFVQSVPSAPLLTTIVSNDGIYADFEVDEQTYVKGIRTQAKTHAQEQTISVQMTVTGDSGRVYTGTIYSFDNHIDTASGTIRARARFPNEDGSLLPGMFVSVKLSDSGDTSALMVPERAIGSDQNKRFVLLAGPDDKVVYREITLGGQVGDQRLVTSGLADGARVIVDGLQHVRPNALVSPTETAMQQPQGAAKPATK
jgi:multidrug efflux system membrane fusion protein